MSAERDNEESLGNYTPPKAVCLDCEKVDKTVCSGYDLEVKYCGYHAHVRLYNAEREIRALKEARDQEADAILNVLTELKRRIEYDKNRVEENAGKGYTRSLVILKEVMQEVKESKFVPQKSIYVVDYEEDGRCKLVGAYGSQKLAQAKRKKLWAENEHKDELEYFKIGVTQLHLVDSEEEDVVKGKS